MNYREILNRHALSSIDKPEYIPDITLMIGETEDLSGQPVMIPVKKVPKEVALRMEKQSNMTDEEVFQAINDQSLEVDDFNDNVLLLGISGLGVI